MAKEARGRDEGGEEQTRKKSKIARQRNKQQEVDMISQLPDEILYTILGLLTLKEACITSALSKRWRNLFPSLPRLVFDHLSFFYSFGEHDPWDKVVDMEWWLEAARDVLESRRAPVRICTIRSAHFDEHSEGIGDIIHFLCNDGIQELSIHDVADGRMRFTVPSSLYFCQSLTRIELSRCILKVPARFCLLRRLNTLKIGGCIVEDSDLQRLILGCRNVSSLTLRHGCRLRNLAVDAPKLEVLDVTTHRPLFVSIVNAPLLESLTVRFRYDLPETYYLNQDPEDVSDTDDEDDDDEASRLASLLESIGGIRNLSLEYQNKYLKRRRTEGVPVPLLVTMRYILPKMRKLTLKMQLSSTFVLSVVNCLIHSCLKLEDLVIVLDNDDNNHQCLDASVLKYWDTKIPSVCMRYTLCAVSFCLEKGCYWMPGIELVKFLLNNARALKKLVINCCHQKGELSILKDLHKEMFMLRPASPSVDIELTTTRRRIVYTPSRVTFDAL